MREILGDGKEFYEAIARLRASAAQRQARDPR